MIEPIFGQLKQVLGFRQFSLRGLASMRGEWRLMATVHNLLKLWRHDQQVARRGDPPRDCREISPRGTVLCPCGRPGLLRVAETTDSEDFGDEKSQERCQKLLLRRTPKTHADEINWAVACAKCECPDVNDMEVGVGILRNNQGRTLFVKILPDSMV